MRERSAGIILVIDDGGEWRVLLLRAYRNWDFPKGVVKLGENPLQAALRETAEETGIANVELKWGTDSIETAPYRGGKVARYFLALVRRPEVILRIDPELGRPEHHEYRWVTFAQASALLPPRLTPILEWARDRLIPDRGA
jgi:8-oxo-dGTP pyrophosphatase MutT (NUDIX family)